MLGTDTFGTNATDTLTHVALYIRIEVLPDVPPVVPLDLCLGVHLEVLTSSDPT